MPPTTAQTFADLGVPSDLVDALAKRGITEPFPIQAATIADALAGRDVCGCAPTGSGKTLAFGIPIITMVERARPGRPHALVLAPTRELAAQIEAELRPLAAVRGRSILAVYGGVAISPQRNAIRRGVDILVATPGRLKDLIEQGIVGIDKVNLVVVDEADRMADMGFMPDVRKLLDQTSRDRQTVLFSATLDGDIAVLTREYQSSPVRHDIARHEDEEADVRHLFWRLDLDQRSDVAARIAAACGPTIIFCRTRHGSDRVAKQIAKFGVRTEAIHGARSQSQRTAALAAFSSGRAQALIATDVAARGIHVDGVACVIHFDPPEDSKAYTHRSGRTGRAGSTGIVVSLLEPKQTSVFKSIRKDLDLDASLTVPLFEVLETLVAERPAPALSRRSEEQWQQVAATAAEQAPEVFGETRPDRASAGAPQGKRRERYPHGRPDRSGPEGAPRRDGGYPRTDGGYPRSTERAPARPSASYSAPSSAPRDVELPAWKVRAMAKNNKSRANGPQVSNGPDARGAQGARGQAPAGPRGAAPRGAAPYGQAPRGAGPAPYGQAPRGAGPAPYGAPRGQAPRGAAPHGQAARGTAPRGAASRGRGPSAGTGRPARGR